jgi:hypothetical protein
MDFIKKWVPWDSGYIKRVPDYFPEDLREEERKFLPSVVLAEDSGVFTPETPVSTHRRFRSTSGPSPDTTPKPSWIGVRKSAGNSLRVSGRTKPSVLDTGVSCVAPPEIPVRPETPVS